MSTGGDVEVLIPHLDRKESLRRTLESLEAQTVVPRICVADNCSSDGTLEMLAADFAEVRVVKLSRNHGFGGALNRAAADSTASLLVFLNNDAVAEPTFLEALLRTREQTGSDVVAGCLRSPAGPVESMGVEMDRSLNAYDVGFGLEDPREYAGSDPLGPCGGATLISTAAFARVGGFDEDFFAYLEDVDLAIRLRMRGYRCAIAADAIAWHHHSATLGARSSRKNELLGEGRGRLIWKYGRSVGRAARARGLAADAVVYAGKAVVDRNLGGFRGRVRVRRRLRGTPRPQPDPDFSKVALVDRSLFEGLGLRLRRRR